MRKTLFIYQADLAQEPSGWLLRDENNHVETQQPGLPSAAQCKNQRVVLIIGAQHSLCVAAQFPGRKNLNAWRKSAPWIIEDQLAEGTEGLHFAIGAQALSDGRYWLAATELEPLQALLERFEQAHIHVDAMTLDACLLPQPETDAGLSYANIGTRVLIRDSNGVASLNPALATALTAEQNPWLDCEQAIGALDALSQQWQASSSLNLRQGILAPGEAMINRLRPWRGAALAASLAALLWTGSSALELSQLKTENQQLQNQIQQLFNRALPGAKMQKPRIQLEQALRSGQSNAGGGLLLALEQSSNQLKNIDDVQLLSLDQRGSQLVLNLSASKISTVETVKQALSNLPGYNAEVGSVRADADNVQLRVTLRPSTAS